MNDLGTNVVDAPAAEERGIKEKERFFPTGAIVFFILLVFLCIAFWFGIYSLMIQRT